MNHLHSLLFVRGLPASTAQLRDALVTDPNYLHAVEEYCDSVYKEEVLLDTDSFVCTSCGSNNLVSVNIDSCKKPSRPVPKSQPTAVVIRCGDCGDAQCAQELIRAAALTVLDHSVSDDAALWASLFRNDEPSFLAKEGPPPSCDATVRGAVISLKVLLTNYHDPHHRATCFKTGCGCCRFHYPKKCQKKTTIHSLLPDGARIPLCDVPPDAIETVMAISITSRRGKGSNFVNGYSPLMVRLAPTYDLRCSLCCM